MMIIIIELSAWLSLSGIDIFSQARRKERGRNSDNSSYTVGELCARQIGELFVFTPEITSWWTHPNNRRYRPDVSTP